MNVPVKLAAFAVGLVACFAVGLGIGAAVGPIDDGASQPTHVGTHVPVATTAGHDMGGH